MYSKIFIALVATGLVSQAIAGPHHGLRHVHQKRAYVTELTTVTNWVTVTVYEDDIKTDSPEFYTNSRKLRPQPSSESSTSSPPAPSPVVATTIATQVISTSATPEQDKSPVVQAAPAPSSSTSSPPEAVNTPVPSSTAEPVAAPVPVPSPAAGSSENAGSAETGSSNNNNANTGNGDGASSGGSGSAGGGAKRGLAYNHPELLQRFLNSGTKVSWAYNWGQSDDSGTDLEFCPMLWGLKLDFAETWPANAQKAIDAGSRCLLSFNEPDLGEQANLSPQVAAQKHIELMNPFSGKALIGSPAITNGGGDNMGIGWMRQWFDACGGQCAVDFINIHIYGVDTNTFLAHLRNVHDTFKKPVWITEFAFGGSESEINSQLATVIDQIETNSTYSFVDRYSYFMVQDGFMVKGNSLSTYGNTFAYGA